TMSEVRRRQRSYPLWGAWTMSFTAGWLINESLRPLPSPNTLTHTRTHTHTHAHTLTLLIVGGRNRSVSQFQETCTAGGSAHLAPNQLGSARAQGPARSFKQCRNT